MTTNCAKIFSCRNRVISSSDDSDNEDASSYKLLKSTVKQLSILNDSSIGQVVNDNISKDHLSFKKRCNRSFHLFSSDDEDEERNVWTNLNVESAEPDNNLFKSDVHESSEHNKCIESLAKDLDDFLLERKHKNKKVFFNFSSDEDLTSKEISCVAQESKQKADALFFDSRPQKDVDSKGGELDALESVVEVYDFPDTSKGRSVNTETKSPKKSKRKKTRRKRTASDIPAQTTLLTLQDTFLFDTGNSDDERRQNADLSSFAVNIKKNEKAESARKKSKQNLRNSETKKTNKPRPPTKAAVFDAYSHTFRLIREQKVNLPVVMPKHYDVDEYFDCIRKRREEHRLKNLTSEEAKKNYLSQNGISGFSSARHLSDTINNFTEQSNGEASDDIRTVSTGVSFEKPLNSVGSDKIVTNPDTSSNKRMPIRTYSDVLNTGDSDHENKLPDLNHESAVCVSSSLTSVTSRAIDHTSDNLTAANEQDSDELKGIIELLYPDDTSWKDTSSQANVNKSAGQAECHFEGSSDGIVRDREYQDGNSTFVKRRFYYDKNDVLDYQVSPSTGVPKYAFSVQFAVDQLDKFASINMNTPSKLKAIEQMKSQLLDGSLLETFERLGFFPDFNVDSFDEIILVPRTPEISITSSESNPIKITVPSSVPEEDYSSPNSLTPKLSSGSGFINLVTQEVEPSLPRKVDGFVRRLCKHVAMKINNKDDAIGQTTRASRDFTYGSTHELKGLKKWFTVKEELKRRMKEKLFFRISNRLANLRGDFEITSSVDEIPSSVINDGGFQNDSTVSSSCQSDMGDNERIDEPKKAELPLENKHMDSILREVINITNASLKENSGTKPDDSVLKDVIGLPGTSSGTVSTNNNTNSYITPYQRPAFEDTDIEPRPFKFWEPGTSISTSSEKQGGSSPSFCRENSENNLNNSTSAAANTLNAGKNNEDGKKETESLSQMILRRLLADSDAVVDPSQCSLTQLDRCHGLAVMKRTTEADMEPACDSHTCTDRPAQHRSGGIARRSSSNGYNEVFPTGNSVLSESNRKPSNDLQSFDDFRPAPSCTRGTDEANNFMKYGDFNLNFINDASVAERCDHSSHAHDDLAEFFKGKNENVESGMDVVSLSDSSKVEEKNPVNLSSQNNKDESILSAGNATSLTPNKPVIDQLSSSKQAISIQNSEMKPQPITTNRLSSRILSNFRSLSPSVHSLRLVLDGSDSSEKSVNMIPLSKHHVPQTKKITPREKIKTMSPFVNQTIERELKKSQILAVSSMNEKPPEGELFDEFREACKIEPELKALMNDSYVYRMQRTRDWVNSLPTVFEKIQNDHLIPEQSQDDDAVGMNTNNAFPYAQGSPGDIRKRKSMDRPSGFVSMDGQSDSDVFSFSQSKKRKPARILDDSDDEVVLNNEETEQSSAKGSILMSEVPASSGSEEDSFLRRSGDEIEKESDASQNRVTNEEVEESNRDSVPKQNFRIEEFFDDEAELSGSDVESADEEHVDDDEELIDELGIDNDEDFDAHELQNEIGQIHLKRMLEDDKKNLRFLKEKFLDDGDLYEEEGRKRRYHWIKNEEKAKDLVDNQEEVVTEEKEEESDSSSIGLPEFNFVKFKSILKDDEESSASSDVAEPKPVTQENVSNSFMQNNYYIVKEEQYNRFSWNPAHRQISFIGLGSQFLNRLSEISEADKLKGSVSGPNVFDVDLSEVRKRNIDPVNDENEILAKPKKKMMKRNSQRKDDVTIFGFIS